MIFVREVKYRELPLMAINDVALLTPALNEGIRTPSGRRPDSERLMARAGMKYGDNLFATTALLSKTR